jgi:hypothetical protein
VETGSQSQSNQAYASVTAELIRYLLEFRRQKIEAMDIAVIVPYEAQRAKVANILTVLHAQHPGLQVDGVHAGTIDKFQGQLSNPFVMKLLLSMPPENCLATRTMRTLTGRLSNPFVRKLLLRMLRRISLSKPFATSTLSRMTLPLRMLRRNHLASERTWHKFRT